MKLTVDATKDHFILQTGDGELLTPKQRVLRLSTRKLAKALAEELSSVDEPDPHEPGLYGFASTEIDFVHDNRERIEEVLNVQGE